MLGPFLIAAVRRPSRTIALFALLLGTRSERITLSDSKSGQDIHDYFSQRSLGVLPITRFCRGVLLLPQDHADYLRGRRRQALRTNLRRAAEAGIRCEIVSDRSGTVEDLRLLLERRPVGGENFDADGWRGLIERPELTLIVARSATGRPVALVGMLIDHTICLLQFGFASDDHARWILHDYLVRMLIERRISCLVASGGGPFGALGFSPGVQHYQHLLGYELRHLVPGRTRVPRRRRMLTYLILLVAAASLLIPAVAAGLGRLG